MNMRRSIALTAAITLCVTLFAADDPNRIAVPRISTAPTIDGTINRMEWKGAVRVPLSGNQGYALLTHDGNFLYVGLVGAKPGVASLCTRGKSGVRVFHASAALGTAAFLQEKGKWRMTRGFTWTNRDTGKSEAAIADRNKTLATTAWFANTSPTATVEREYQISVRGLREVPLTITFFTYTPEEQKLHYWPASLEDDCADSELAGGFTDREYTFDPSKWGLLVLQ